MMVRFLRLFFVALFTLSGNTIRAAEPQPQAVNNLNVILITADAMRGDMQGVNGNAEVKTPVLDALAEEGINFRRAYCNITTTTPSHATLLTSLYPFEHKAYSNTAKISSRIVTLPELLARAGWHTAAIVNFPWLNLDVSNVPQGVAELAACKHIRKADKTNRWVLKFLDSRKGEKKPFFLWIHYIDNHTPYHAPGKYERMYYPDGRDPRKGKAGSLQAVWHLFPEHHRDDKFFKRWLRGITDVDYVVASNKGSVSWIDEKVGEVIDRLEHNGQWSRTMFVFTSDHGESLGEHGLYFLHGGLFEVTARVPLIIRLPDGPAGRQIDAVVSLVDVMPTILARLGLEIPDHLRGEDLWSLLKGGKLSGGAALIQHAGNYLIGAVTPRYKYIRHRVNKVIYPSYPMKKGKEELYDLNADPAEKNDISKQRPDLLKEMRALVKKLRAGQKMDFAGGRADMDEQTREMLRSLGYTE